MSNKIHEIVKREFDGKFVVWAQVDHPDADLDFHRKSGLPVPQAWVPIAVTDTEVEAQRASNRSRV